MHRRLEQMIVVSVAVPMWLGGAGCAASGGHGTPSAHPALITHPVFFTLTDPDDAPELIHDCDEWIARIPGILSYVCGVPYESGRERVDGAYDVGLVLGFGSKAAYAAYVDHPDHRRLQEKWRPRLRSVDIRDVIDDRP